MKTPFTRFMIQQSVLQVIFFLIIVVQIRIKMRTREQWWASAVDWTKIVPVG